MTRLSLSLFVSAASTVAFGFQPNLALHQRLTECRAAASSSQQESTDLASRRDFFAGVIGASAVAATCLVGHPQEAQAVGPVKINLLNPKYTAIPCPKDKPIPGEKAMKGMRGLCVTVDVDMENSPEKELELVGVYGYVTDAVTGESVLANNPDLSTDAGQFAMIPVVKISDKKLRFEFIAAVPKEMVSLESDCFGIY